MSDEFDVFTGDPPRTIMQCCCCIPTLAITLWIGLSFKLHGPRFYVGEFYVPALDLTESPPPNTTAAAAAAINPCLFFDLKLENILGDRSIRYGDVNVTFSYGRTPVANYTVPPFYQGKSKTANRREVVETRGVPWDHALNAVGDGLKAVFRVDVVARPRFRFWFWNSKKKHIKIGADVEVGPAGMKLDKDDIRLNSAASKRPHLILFLTLYLVTFLCI